MTRVLYYLLTGSCLLWVQLAFQYRFGHQGIQIDFIMLGVFYLALRMGSLPAEIFGFILGLFVDASWMGVLGLRALLYASEGFFVGLVQRDVDTSKLWTQIMGSFVIGIVMYSFQTLLLRLMTDTTITWYAFTLKVVLTTLVAPVFFWAFHFWTKSWGILNRDGMS